MPGPTRGARCVSDRKRARQHAHRRTQNAHLNSAYPLLGGVVTSGKMCLLRTEHFVPFLDRPSRREERKMVGSINHVPPCCGSA